MDSKRKIINNIFFKVVEFNLEPLHVEADLRKDATCVYQTATSGFGGTLYKGGRVVCLLTFQSDILNTLFSGSSVRCPEIHRCAPFEEVENAHDEELESTFNTPCLAAYSDIKLWISY